MSLINITFVILFCLTMWILYSNGKKIQKLPDNVDMKRYMKTCIPSIISYTLNEGLRFGRGIDYNLYAIEYVNNTGINYFEKGDMGFRLIGITLQSLGLPFQAYVILMSFILILSFLIFLKNYKNCAPYSLPLFLLMFYLTTENLMRWFLGFSFILIGFSFVIKNNASKKSWLYFSIFTIIAFFFHFGTVIVPFFYFFLIRYEKPLLKPFWSILIFFIIGFSFQTQIMLYLKNYLDILLLLSDKSAYYIENSDQWLTGGATSLVFTSFPPLFRMLLYFSEVWLGYDLCKYLGRKYTVLYNLFLFGFILLPIANQIELVLRYQYLFFIFHVFVLGYILDYYFVTKREPLQGIKYLFTILAFLYFSQGQIKKWFIQEEEFRHLYIWNSEGEDYIDVYNSYYFDIKK